MKLADFDLADRDPAATDVAEKIAQINATTTAYPRHSTVHELFSALALAQPDATAVYGAGRVWSYRELEQQSNRVARLLVSIGLPRESVIGVWTREPFELLTALLGIMKAGCAYLPFDEDMPYQRVRYMLSNSAAPALLLGKTYAGIGNRLQWDCADLRQLVCLDSQNFTAETEGSSRAMVAEIFDHFGRTAFDDISAGGWTSSFTGQWLSREVMDGYGDNALAKLRPFLHSETRVLEIGCASGITMFRLAPLCGHYVGTDLSSEILAFTRAEMARRGVSNISLFHLPADGIDQLAERDFDVVVCNSVAQSFAGHNYFRDVVGKAIGTLGRKGVIFYGNIWDQEQRETLVAALADFKLRSSSTDSRTKTDHLENLFLSRAFFADLRHSFPEIVDVGFSTMLGAAHSELSDYGYDVVLRIDKDNPSSADTLPSRAKMQYDLSHLPQDATPLRELSGPRGLANVMYTSGTTGNPKGVMVEHRSIVRLVRDTNYVTLGPDDCVLQTGAVSFDASTFDIWGALLNGGRLVMPPRLSILDPTQLKEIIAVHGVTTLLLTTSLFNRLVTHDVSIFTGVRQLLVGGERLSPSHINQFRSAHAGAVVMNVYGPTESTSLALFHHITCDYQRDIPLGKPISNTQVAILDDAGRLLDVGAVGEICIGGDGVARGYLRDSALTARKFFQHSFAEGGRAYHSGDLGCWAVDGTVQFLGRLDDQIKIRGFRIEPAEIEARLLAIAGVREAAVVCHDDGNDKELVAYWAGDDVDPSFVRAALALDLPEVMVPYHYVRLEHLPLTSRGKLDRRALPPPSTERDSPGAAGSRPAWAAPANETERTMVAIWREVLNVSDIGVEDDFFAAGGHSLRALKLTSLIQKQLGVTMPFSTIFAARTVRALAQRALDCARYGEQALDQPLVTLHLVAGSVPVFAFPPGTGDALGYSELAKRLPFCTFHAFNFIDADTRLQDYADLIMRTDPDGPYLLFGYSAGGNLAFHVTKELERRGRRVTAIVMFDSGRVLEKFRFPDEEVARLADDFLEAEGVKEYVHSAVLRDKATRTIQKYLEALSQTKDDGVIDAGIHLVQSEGSEDTFTDDRGIMISSKSAWADVTRRGLTSYQARGIHAQLLNEPNLDPNAALLGDIIRGLVNARAPAVREGWGGQ